jgi:ADP-L-glycero-D-manno-heptose 6-epimerase
MIIVTGAAGFIASALVARLNELRYFDLILVDDFSREDRKVNYENKKFTSLLDRKELFSFIEKNENHISILINFTIY